MYYEAAKKKNTLSIRGLLNLEASLVTVCISVTYYTNKYKNKIILKLLTAYVAIKLS